MQHRGNFCTHLLRTAATLRSRGRVGEMRGVEELARGASVHGEVVLCRARGGSPPPFPQKKRGRTRRRRKSCRLPSAQVR